MRQLEYIYLTCAVSKEVLACFGQSQVAMEKAVNYAIRLYALHCYLSIRQGYAPSARSTRIMARTGRPLGKGDRIDARTRGRFIVDGKHRSRRQGAPAQECVCVIPGAKWAAADSLERRFSKTWSRYLATVP